MAYALKPGLSFCHVAGRLIFLDLGADRYFCLSAEAERSLARAIAEAPAEPEDAAILAGLQHQGMLRTGTAEPLLRPCPGVCEARSSMLDAHPIPVPPLGTFLAGMALLRAPLRLRLFGLSAAIARLQIKKARLRPARFERERLARSGGAFARLRALATSHDQCLPRSLAVAEQLFTAGVRADLILAVKLQPFAAHAWVQWGDIVVNDRVDAVRDFTPILVV